MNIDFLHKIRQHELKMIIEALNNRGKNIKILEIGSGTGHQAKKLKDLGYEVEAIDLESSSYKENRIFAITNYDGKHIPFQDSYFDLIFSSNVLEHIPHLDEFQFEMQRVLKNDGIAIHIVPSTAWRFWTSITHYAYILSRIYARLFSKSLSSNNIETVPTNNNRALKDRILNLMIATRHGEKGNRITELYYFSKYYWDKIFQKNWTIARYDKNHLYYSGYMLCKNIIPFDLRIKLSKIIGSSCHFYILKKPQ